MYGGAICLNSNSNIIFKENFSALFKNNIANIDGGALSTYSETSFEVMHYVAMKFMNNSARYGGAMYFDDNNHVIFSEITVETFENNSASYGGAIFLNSNSIFILKENSSALFKNNVAFVDGGALSIYSNSSLKIMNYVAVKFVNNSAYHGGAVYFYKNNDCSFSENAVETFESNSALYGGAICLNRNSNITFKENSTVLFKNNIANIEGGALSIYSDSSFEAKNYATLEFTANNAGYGGAMYFDTTHSTLVIKNHKGKKEFTSNTAKFAGENIYIDLTKSCNRSCLHTRIINISNESVNFTATPPSKLVLSDPAACIDDKIEVECKKYLLHHVMLGEEINVPATVLDYCDHSSYKAQFLLHTSVHRKYSISGSREFLLSIMARFQGLA